MKEVWVVSRSGYIQVIVETEKEAKTWYDKLTDGMYDRLEIQRWTLGLMYGVEK